VKYEQVVVGCVLLAADKERTALVDTLLRVVREDMFTCGMAKACWKFIVASWQAECTPDEAILIANGADADYMQQAQDAVGSLANWKWYVKQVTDAYRLRELEKRNRELQTIIKQGEGKDAMAFASRMIDNLGDPTQVTYTPEDSLLELEFSKFEVVPSGLGIMDAPQAGGGWVKGEMSLLCAATGRGKTLMALQSALYALRHGKRVAFATFEMPHIRLTQRMLQMICGYKSKYEAQKFHQEKAWADACEEFMSFKDRFLYFDSGLDMSKKRYVEPFCSWAMQQMDSNPMDVWFFDYLQKVRPEKSRGNRNEDMDEVALQLSGLANITKTAGVVLAQVKPGEGGELRLRHSLDPEDHCASMVFRGSVQMGKGKDAAKVEAWWHEKNRHARMLAQSCSFDEQFLTVTTTGVLER